MYSKGDIPDENELQIKKLTELDNIVSVIKNFTFFAEEKWKIASDKSGSGNTANIGSIKNISNIINGNGTFSKAGEAIFDDYWSNYGKITFNGKPIKSLREYLTYRGLPKNLINEQPKKKNA